MTGAGPARTRLQAAAAARADALRRPRRRAGAAPPALSSSPATGTGRWWRSSARPGSASRASSTSSPTRIALQGWLVLESASVSYGKATSYLPVIDLLKGYFKIQDRDDLREIREKVTGKLLTLDRALEPTLPALLALLDVPVDDAAWQTLDPRQRRQRTLDAVKRLLLREAQEQPLLADLRGPPLDRRRDPGAARRPGREPAGSARLLLLVNYRPEYQHAWGSKTLLQPAAARRAAGRERRGAARGAARRRSRARRRSSSSSIKRRGNPFFLEETRPDAGGDEGAGGRARRAIG